MVTDEKKHYFVTLSKNKTETGIQALDKFLINSRTPHFHGNEKYDPLGVIEFIEKESAERDNPLF